MEDPKNAPTPGTHAGGTNPAGTSGPLSAGTAPASLLPSEGSGDKTPKVGGDTVVLPPTAVPDLDTAAHDRAMSATVVTPKGDKPEEKTMKTFMDDDDKGTTAEHGTTEGTSPPAGAATTDATHSNKNAASGSGDDTNGGGPKKSDEDKATDAAVGSATEAVKKMTAGIGNSKPKHLEVFKGDHGRIHTLIDTVKKQDKRIDALKAQLAFLMKGLKDGGLIDLATLGAELLKLTTALDQYLVDMDRLADDPVHAEADEFLANHKLDDQEV